MRNLTDHRIDGADGLGVQLVRCTCGVRWMPPSEFTEHIAEIAADTREERVRAMMRIAEADKAAAAVERIRAETARIRAQTAAESAKHSATLAQNAANYSRDRAGMNHTPGTDYPAKRRRWEL